jgi:hypothetical protein
LMPRELAASALPAFCMLLISKWRRRNWQIKVKCKQCSGKEYCKWGVLHKTFAVGPKQQSVIDNLVKTLQNYKVSEQNSSLWKGGFLWNFVSCLRNDLKGLWRLKCKKITAILQK